MSSLQIELVLSPKVCDDQNKKVFAYQLVGFWSQKKKQKNKWCHPKMVTPAPP